MRNCERSFHDLRTMTSLELNSEAKEQEVFLPFHLGYLTTELVEKAKRDFGETEEVKQKGLKELKKMLDGVSNLIYNKEDNFLVPFLRVAKYNIERAYVTILNFYKFQRHFYKTYDFAAVENIVKNFENNVLGTLPYRDSKGSIIILFKFGQWNPRSTPIEELLFLGLMMGLHAIKDPATQVAGFKFLVDLKGCGRKQFSYFTPYYVKFCLNACIRCFPGRYVQFHILNEPELFSYIWKFLKLFINKKIEKRFIFHGDKLESLHQYISPRILPEEYGGSNGPFDNRVWVDIYNDRKFLKESRQYGFRH